MLSQHVLESLGDRLQCPRCSSPLARDTDRLTCRNAACGAVYPIVTGVPVLVNDASSIFSIQDFVARRDTTAHLAPPPLERLLQKVESSLPSIGVSIRTRENYAQFRDSLLLENPAPKVLVVGGSILGNGMETLVDDPHLELIGTDVSFGPFTAIVCDAHDIPFADGTFDGVIVQAVLEHVVDPHRCVQEIHRVLKDRGLVYAETPFMQQVHMGPYDFTRFTHSGHRRMFRQFTEVASGPISGPGSALAWSYQYFLMSFSSRKAWRGFARAFASLTSFHLKYFDYLLIDGPGAVDSASGFYFTGRKQASTLSDRELVKYYRGAISS